MDVFQAITTRRSIRRFKPDPVPEALIREILDAARWSPSWGNTQPWEIVVVTGEPLERFKKANRQRILLHLTAPTPGKSEQLDLIGQPVDLTQRLEHVAADDRDSV